MVSIQLFGTRTGPIALDPSNLDIADDIELFVSKYLEYLVEKQGDFFLAKKIINFLKKLKNQNVVRYQKVICGFNGDPIYGFHFLPYGNILYII